jgi:Ca2+-transporting ATPase
MQDEARACSRRILVEGDVMNADSTAAARGTGPAWHALAAERALELLASHEERGLATSEARARLSRHGPNVIERKGGPGVLTLMARQVKNPIVYLLLGSAALAILLGKVLDGMVVLGALVVNAVIGFLQEFRAGKAIEALSRMVPQEAQVVRDGRMQSVSTSELVPGDILLLASGDRVPADVRLLASKNLQVEEAALTGESLPAAKSVAPVDEHASVGDRRGMAFGGTLVTSGTGRAVVVETGGRSELGRISHMLEEASELQTPLTRALAAVGTWLTFAVLAIAALLLAVSLLRGYSLADGLLVAIALAVAAIPEGLPAIITIALAIGVQRMAARNAVIRKLPSVETLGSTTVICSDKTGTLTRNEMTVQALSTAAEAYTLSGVGYAPEGYLSSSGGRLATAPEDVKSLVEAAVLCSDASVHAEGDQWKVSGDPTEGALVVAAMKAGIDVQALRAGCSRLDVIPFESEHQFMATLHPTGQDGENVVFIKGAPEVILRRCGDGDARWEDAMSRVASLASEGMRVLAVASKRVSATVRELQTSDATDGFEFLGLAGMLDPPRPEAVAAVKTCQAAGVTVKMITGDHLGTAESIGRQLGILAPDGKGITGAELEALDDAQLREVAGSINVFARVAPEHKLRLVKALQAATHVVAMTGDGVNDAPALKQANVGVAMGITGTAVSKEAADVVLADDNFASIASAVEEGRRIYDNLVKSLAFVLPTNLGLGFILMAAVAFFPVVDVGGERVPLMPVLPTQLLWINLVASVALSLPLAFEVEEPDTMNRPPRATGTPIFGRFVILRTLLVAAVMTAGALGLFLWEYWTEVPHQGHAVALREAQTMAVTTVMFFQIFYLFNCRSLRTSVFQLGFFSNRTVFVGIFTLLLLQAGFIYLPFMQSIFGTAALTPGAIALSALVGAVVLPLISLEKRLRGRSAPSAEVPRRSAPGDAVAPPWRQRPHAP